MTAAPGDPGQEGRDRLLYLDGLRGWASLAVVIFHATSELFGNYLPRMRPRAAGLVNDGNLAVYIFFVLSGFVLSFPYLNRKRMEIVRDAAIRRYVRLVIPIAAASTLAFVMMSSGLLFNVESSRIVNSSDWLGLFYRQSPNIFGMLRFFLFDVFFRYDLATSYGAFLWTMAYELAGSFMVFAVLALAGDSLKTRAVWYAALALVCHFQAQVLITFLCGMVSAEFALSAALGRFRAGRWANGLGTGLLAAVFAGSVLLRTHYTTELRAGLALLTLWAVVISRWLRTLLETRLSRWLGRISFPLYLVHSLVICGPSSFLIIELTRRGWSHVSIVAAVVPFTLVAALGAAALFSPVERWAIQASRWFSGLILPPRSAAAP